MKKSLIIFTVLISFVGACQFETSTSTGISVEDSDLARTAEGGITATDDAVFSPNEDIHMVLYNVGPFKEGEDGLHWFDMDLEVLDQDGNVLLSQTGMLGENGHLELENGMAASPYATFSPNETLEPGAYKIKVRIYDRVGKGKASVTKSFTLE